MKNWTPVFSCRFDVIEDCLFFVETFRKNLKHSNALDLNEIEGQDFSFPSGIGKYSTLIINKGKCGRHNTPSLYSNAKSSHWAIQHFTITGHTKLSVRVYTDYATVFVFRDFEKIRSDFGHLPYERKPVALEKTIEFFQSPESRSSESRASTSISSFSN